MIYPFYRELELIKPLSDYFKKQGYIIKHEVKIGFCRADLIAYKKDEVIAIELKLKDWKKAIIQAKNYQLGCDYVYLAFPLMSVYNIIKKAEHLLKKEGIGLLIITEDSCEVRKIIEAKPSKKKICSINIKEIIRNQKRKIIKRKQFQY
jgi:hypothetical protein